MEIKKCNKCNNYKPLIEFKTYKKDGINYQRQYCNDCLNDYRRQYRKIKKVVKKSHCKYCGNEFELNRSDKVYCSVRCQEKSAWERRKKDLKKVKRDKERAIIYREKHKEIIRVKKAKYQKENWDERKKYHKRWTNKNYKHVLTYNKKQLEKSRENLDDWYIRSMISQNSILKSTDIPQELVEVKREQIRIMRLIKKMSN